MSHVARSFIDREIEQGNGPFSPLVSPITLIDLVSIRTYKDIKFFNVQNLLFIIMLEYLLI